MGPGINLDCSKLALSLTNYIVRICHLLFNVFVMFQLIAYDLFGANGKRRLETLCEETEISVGISSLLLAVRIAIACIKQHDSNERLQS